MTDTSLRASDEAQERLATPADVDDVIIDAFGQLMATFAEAAAGLLTEMDKTAERLKVELRGRAGS